MAKLSRRSVWLMTVSAVVLAGLVLGLLLVLSVSTPVDYERMFRETQEVVLVFYNPHPGGEVVLTEDSKEIQALVATIRLVPKDPCQCAFDEYLVFHTRGGDMNVYVSDHTFNVNFKGSVKVYKMPEGFWPLFQSYRKRALGKQ